MSTGTDLMGDVYAKLRWAEKHLGDLMTVGEAHLMADGGDGRPTGINFDFSHPPLVVARFIVEKPMPVEAGLHAADLIHNARTALDHVLARLKDHFDGNARRGTFPVTESDADWKGRVYPRGDDGRRKPGPLDGLPCSARRMIYRDQPHVVFASRRREDPLVVLSGLDNDDKHRLLHPVYAYPEADRGLDLIDVRDRRLVLSEENVWTAGQPLDDGTVMARFVLHPRTDPRRELRVDRAAQLKLSAGPVDSPPIEYEAIISRVRGIVDRAVALVDA